MVDGSGSTDWIYDIRGRMTHETKSITGSGNFLTRWGYDLNDRPSWMTYPGGNSGTVGEQVNFTYHKPGWLSTVAGTNTYVRKTDYDAAGRVEWQELGLAGGNYVIGLDYAYYPWTTANGLGRLQSLKAGVPGNLTSLLNFSYTFEAMGNVSFITDTKAGGVQTQAFTYDSLDRLVTAQATGGSGGEYGPETYTYSATGNMISNSQWGTYAYSTTVSGCQPGTPALKPHAMSGFTSSAGTLVNVYDCNGNLIVRNPGTAYTLTYDAENRLVQVAGGSGGSFVYDGDGARVRGTVSGVTRAYIGNLYEWTDSASTARSYYYAGATRVAVREGSTLYFLLGDHLGSTSKTATATGALEAEWRYRAWGGQRYFSGTVHTTFRFTGQRFEPGLAGAAGLHDYGARWYLTAYGQWIQPDTLVPDVYNPQDLNRYAYVRNNPVKYTDPTGHFPWLPLAIVAAIMLVVITSDTAQAPPNTNYPLNASGQVFCSSSLPNCFGDTVYLDAFVDRGEANPIPIGEFEAFADKVAADLHAHDLTWPGLAAGRHTYDTPFYNGGESPRRSGDPNSQTGVFPANQQVCIEGIRCSGRSEINYLAQGMWGAAVGEPKAVTEAIAKTWKLVEYGDSLSEGSRFWLNYGYDHYHRWQNESPQ